MHNISGSPRWYALQVRSNHEKVIETVLRSKGFESFVPMYRTRRVWSDRVKEIELPVFAGYVFCRFEISDRTVPVITTPGIVRVLGFGNRPEPVDEQEILALQRVVASGVSLWPWTHLKTGSIVRICHGSLSGLEGIYMQTRKSHRIVISVTLLQRSVAIEMDPAWLVPIGESRELPDSVSAQAAAK